MPVMRARQDRTDTEEASEWHAMEFAPSGRVALREMRSPGDVRAGPSDAAVPPRRDLTGR